MRRSRWLAIFACNRTLDAKLLMMRATLSMTAKVTRYSVSLTANEKRGGTKKKSKVITLSTEANIEGPRP